MLWIETEGVGVCYYEGVGGSRERRVCREKERKPQWHYFVLHTLIRLWPGIIVNSGSRKGAEGVVVFEKYWLAARNSTLAW